MSITRTTLARVALPVALAAAVVGAAGPAGAGDVSGEERTLVLDSVERVFPLEKSNVAREDIEVNQLPGSEEFYVLRAAELFLLASADGRYVIRGDVVDTRSVQNLRVESANAWRREMLSRVPDEHYVVYPPKGEVRHTITVITDPTCPYCRKAHEDLPAFAEDGVEVRYLLFPRHGKGSEGYQIAVDAWCAEDQHAAVTAAMNDEPVLDSGACDHPIDDILALAETLGVEATPTTVIWTGDEISGHVSPYVLINAMDQELAIKEGRINRLGEPVEDR